MLQALEDAGGAHAAADAHGDHAVFGVAALEFPNNRSCKFCAGAAERMAQGDSAAVGIDARRIETGLLAGGSLLVAGGVLLMVIAVRRASL